MARRLLEPLEKAVAFKRRQEGTERIWPEANFLHHAHQLGLWQQRQALGGQAVRSAGRNSLVHLDEQTKQTKEEVSQLVNGIFSCEFIQPQDRRLGTSVAVGDPCWKLAQREERSSTEAVLRAVDHTLDKRHASGCTAEGKTLHLARWSM